MALVLEYDGSAYHGFQVQPRESTVQEVVEQAIREFTAEAVRVHCASRTDAGAHAEAQVVSFWTLADRMTDKWVRALNHLLPEDVSVKGAFEIPGEFDVRKNATGRRYRYTILNRATRSALLRGHAHWEGRTLDLEAMNRAAGLLIGEHNFAPFCGSLLRRDAGTIRRLREADFRRDGDAIIFMVEGTSFLPQQMRRMAGALVEVGLARCSLDGFERLARCGVRSSAGPVLPAGGLTLVEVLYDGLPLEALIDRWVGGAPELRDR